MPKITVVTPSVRSEHLPIVKRSLLRQSFREYQWLIVGPVKEANVKEPEKRGGDYYNLNKAWNEAFRRAKGDLIVSIVDGLWFPPDTLQKLWTHYETNPRSCVSAIGHQYDQIESGKPEHKVWADPRARSDFGSFYEVPHTEMELCIASFPRQAVLDVGGVDEEFDKYAACSEKEMMARMYKAGYKLYIDQTIEYRAVQHPRLSTEWDARYEAGIPYYQKCLRDIDNGKRLKLTSL